MLTLSLLCLLFFDTWSQSSYRSQFTAVRFLFFFLLPFKSAVKLKSVCKVSQWGGSLHPELCWNFWTPSAASRSQERRPLKQIEREYQKKEKEKHRETTTRKEKVLFLPMHFHSASFNIGYGGVDLTPKYRACRLFM